MCFFQIVNYEQIFGRSRNDWILRFNCIDIMLIIRFKLSLMIYMQLIFDRSLWLRPRSGQIKSNKVRSVQVRSGQVKSGQVRSDLVRSSQVMSGRVRLVEARSNQIK